jgi:hypothetical protein
MPRLLGRLLQIAQLRSAVAFPERMHIIDVAHDGTSGFREGGPGEAAQEVGLGQAPVDVGHSGADETPELELMAALGDFHRTEFACPDVEILEEVAVDGAEVGEIEMASWDACCVAHRVSSRSRRAGAVMPSLLRRTELPGIV